jgi:hypothetical protein
VLGGFLLAIVAGAEAQFLKIQPAPAQVTEASLAPAKGR